ncbi:MAG: endopeptidase La [Sandaracinus sp.]|nr:endopeptidase La [Sandaracinus sp.]MCB9624331.1 endopeptidase La [Sandaracinus sp.]
MPQPLDLSDLPLLPLRRGVVLPGRTVTLPVGRPRSVALARELRRGDVLVLAAQHDGDVDEPGLADLHRVGVLARLEDRVDRGNRGLVLVVKAERRVHLDELVAHVPFARAAVSELASTNADTDEARALAKSLRAHVSELAGQDRAFVQELSNADVATTADLVAAWVEAPAERRLEILHELDVPTRLKLAAGLVQEAKGRAELQSKVDSEVRKSLSDQQRKHILRQQLEAIRRELGEEDDADDDVAKLRRRLDEAGLTEEAQKVADRELERFAQLPAQSPEKGVIRNYLELIAELPWSKRADSSLDLDAVADKLAADHHGLEEPKRRVLEHMAVLKLAPKARGTVLCLVGPPGVGKTSLAQSVADATGRPLVRVSLGGVRDEAEIRGHRRTYVGALPGRVVSAMRKAGVKNPVVVLDEIDKVGGRSWAGDPETALLEVLDPEQNHTFTDHYLELPFDLSEVLFVATANDLQTLSGPLRDRLEIIEVSGYTEDEKVAIARSHLFPRALERHGLAPEKVRLAEGLLATLVRDYTREAGVRQLDRQLAKLLRSVALDVVRGKDAAVEVDEVRLRQVLGKPRFFTDVAERERPPGVAAGLAWTPVGGDVLYVETTRMPGKGRVEITGQLGEVMNESARAALAYVRTHADALGIDASFLEQQDLHVHVPAGGIPKDGPSAGVTLFTAFASLLSGRRVRPDTAMTGEATLRGRVLPVGGIKSKVLAAHRAGFERVLLPRKNAHDVDDIPESVRSQLEIVLVDDMREVIELALEPLEATTLGHSSPEARAEVGSNPAA